MSQQGWQGFLAADGLDDWVVLHGGAMAFFRVPSLVGAARLAEAVAQVPGLDGALITLTDGQLTVRFDPRPLATGGAARPAGASSLGGSPRTRSND